MSGAKSRRRQRELGRQRDTRQRRAHATQQAQAHAAAKKAHQREGRHRIEAICLFVLAGIIAITHGFEHAGTIQLFNQGLEDLLLGFPMALLLTILGFVRLGT